MRLFTLGAIFLALGGAGSTASALDSAPSRAAGQWRLSEVGGRVACKLTLTLQANFAGYEVKAPLACRLAFPPLQTVAAWTLDAKGGIVLADAKARPIVTFPAQTDGATETKAPDGRTWRLEPLKRDEAPPSRDETAPIAEPGSTPRAP